MASEKAFRKIFEEYLRKILKRSKKYAKFKENFRLP